MINIVLMEPEIPQNTGNIARTCAACGMRLHIIRPIPFEISDRTVKRAGLDYWHLLDLTIYDNFDEFAAKNPGRIFYCTTKAAMPYTDTDFTEDPLYLMFGKETKGLPESLLINNIDRCIRIPMLQNARSLNLSNAVAIIAYEALRQRGFEQLLAAADTLL